MKSVYAFISKHKKMLEETESLVLPRDLYNIVNAYWNDNLILSKYLYIATQYGLLDAVQYLHIHIHDIAEFEYKWFIEEAAWKGHFELFKYFHKHGAKITWLIFPGAIQKGDIRLVKYLYENCIEDIQWTDDYALYVAAIYGHKDVIDYLNERRDVLI